MDNGAKTVYIRLALHKQGKIFAMSSATLIHDSEGLEAKAAKVADILRAIANERRLVLLCHLAQVGEASVGALADMLELSQPAVSQHLARMREEELVTHRREAQTLYYRIADPRVRTLLETLQTLYCQPD